jgi:hypothetical protein
MAFDVNHKLCIIDVRRHDMERVDPADLPVDIAMSAITLTEPPQGPMPPPTQPNVPAGGAVRNGPKPRSTRCRSTPTFGRIDAAVATAGSMAHGRRAFVLVTAATAVAAALPGIRAKSGWCCRVVRPPAGRVDLMGPLALARRRS